MIGLQKFVAYTEDIEEGIEPFEINRHLYADGTQLQKHTRLAAIQTNRPMLELCFEEIIDWCSSPAECR